MAVSVMAQQQNLPVIQITIINDTCVRLESFTVMLRKSFLPALPRRVEPPGGDAFIMTKSITMKLPKTLIPVSKRKSRV